MKNKNSMTKKIQRLTNMLKYEVRSGKCSQEDIDHILNHLRYNVSPWSTDDDKWTEDDNDRVVNK